MTCRFSPFSVSVHHIQARDKFFFIYFFLWTPPSLSPTPFFSVASTFFFFFFFFFSFFHFFFSFFLHFLFVFFICFRPEPIKLIFMLNSAEHEISTAHKTKMLTNKDFSYFQTLSCFIYHAIFLGHINIYEHDRFHAQLS